MTLIYLCQVDAGFANTRIRGATTTEHYYDGCLGNRGAENECPRDRECGAVYRSRKEKNFQRKIFVNRDFDDRIDFNDVKGACSSTDEGLAYNAVEDEVEAEVTNDGVWHSPQLSRKRTGLLFSGGIYFFSSFTCVFCFFFHFRFCMHHASQFLA